MLTRACFAVLVILVATGCPADRTGERTLRGSAMPVPPAMRGLAPPALAVIGELRAPESVLHDAQQDVYFISNINGSLLTIDNNGFISRVNPSTMQVELKWIEGGKRGVTLDAPKGMAVIGETLYVSDVRAVRAFDRRTGEPRGEIALPGAALINDITTDGRSLYVSDTGLLTGPGQSFYRTGSDTIWKITDGRPEKLASTTALQHPNGLDWVEGKLRFVTFGPNELYELSGGKQKRIGTLPYGQLDGLVHLADGTPVVSSWLGDGIYRRSGDGFIPILTGIDAPADIGYDAKRRRLLVPRSGTNQVTIHSLP
ncbi:MAG TPA: hypothetical protein VGF69_00865 [Thermoanaerobaculia bacterium]|jgi:hypothetical protein